MTPKCNKSRHSWRRAQWGCTENPGVTDTGNGAILIADICRHCAVQRSKIRSYCGRTRDNRTTYHHGEA
jgi:hypothetical protein